MLLDILIDLRSNLGSATSLGALYKVKGLRDSLLSFSMHIMAEIPTSTWINFEIDNLELWSTEI